MNPCQIARIIIEKMNDNKRMVFVRPDLNENNGNFAK
jgi:hypothetical protein